MAEVTSSDWLFNLTGIEEITTDLMHRRSSSVHARVVFSLPLGHARRDCGLGSSRTKEVVRSAMIEAREKKIAVALQGLLDGAAPYRSFDRGGKKIR